MAFKSTPDTKMETLWNIFGNEPTIPKEFRIGFRDVSSGKGFERRRITQLNSSSLLAFLCFWDIKNKPVTIDGTQYDKVYFEVENKVFDNPSSVDILLISSDDRTWLFLESKFTEPLTPTNYYRIKEKYYPLYQEIIKNDKLQLSISELERRINKKGDIIIDFKLSDAAGRKEYFGGIKQMISHLIGVIQGFDKREKLEGIGTPNHILLGSILYDFSKEKDSDLNKNYLDYVDFYKRIFTTENSIEIMKIIADCKDVKVNHDLLKISMLNRPLTYQEVFSNSLNTNCLMSKVKAFYNL